MSGRTRSRAGGLAVYVTSHGFGHLNRTAAVLNLVPADVSITIKSNKNLFGHWRERLRRPAEFQSFVCDVGAVNPPGDSAATDGPATLRMAARVHAEAIERLDLEVDRLVREQNAAVLCDAPAIPLLAARRAEIPGFLMTNFTWADIYAPHARKEGGDAVEFVRSLREVYRAATATFRVAPALSMGWMRRVHDIGMVVTRGKDRRAALRKLIGLKPSHKLVYLYVGRYGQSDLDWPRLGRVERAGVHFVTYPPLPAGRPQTCTQCLHPNGREAISSLLATPSSPRRDMERCVKRWPVERRSFIRIARALPSTEFSTDVCASGEEECRSPRVSFGRWGWVGRLSGHFRSRSGIRRIRRMGERRSRGM